ncbi:uncharacterized protein LOC117228109 isoform X1 [Megalopta genalis]|uniref:uncharacterized protein LOC117228109 isoform X1 n=1 Tax=Megalopta genalis TaxID=115081 RepID=UPI003FD370B7
MTGIKRHSDRRSIRKKKGRSRKPNIAMLVYQYLRLGPQTAESEPNSVWSQSPKHRKVVRNSLHPRVTNANNTVNQQRKTCKNCGALRTAEQEKFPKERNYDFEAANETKKYIQKALSFGIEANYLIPVDDSGRIVRVSSDLVHDGTYLRDTGTFEDTVSQDKEGSPQRSPIKWADDDVQDARRQRSRRKRRRSRSRRRRSRRRKRGRRRSRSDNADYEVVEEDDYKFDNQPERKSSSETAGKEKRNDRSHESDGEKTIVQREEEGSDLSLDDDETDEDEKKADDADKS